VGDGVGAREGIGVMVGGGVTVGSLDLVGSGDGRKEPVGTCVGCAEGRGLGRGEDVGICDVGKCVGASDGEACSCLNFALNSSASRSKRLQTAFACRSWDRYVGIGDGFEDTDGACVFVG